MRAVSADGSVGMGKRNSSFDGLLDKLTNTVYAKPGSEIHERLGMYMNDSKEQLSQVIHPLQRTQSANMLIEGTITSDLSEFETRRMRSNERLNEDGVPATIHNPALFVTNCHETLDSDGFAEDLYANMITEDKESLNLANDGVEAYTQAKSLGVTHLLSLSSVTLLPDEDDTLKSTRRTSLKREPTVGIVPRSTPPLVWSDDVVMNDKVVDFALMATEEKRELQKRMKAKFIKKHNSPRVRKANKDFLLHYATVVVPSKN
eukprot:CFRG4815T1